MECIEKENLTKLNKIYSTKLLQIFDNCQYNLICFIKQIFRMPKTTINKLRLDKLTPSQEIVVWYDLYHQYIVNNLHEQQLQREAEISCSKLLEIYVDKKKQLFLKNNILLFFVIFDIRFQHISSTSTINFKKTSNTDIHKIPLFEDIIDVIKRNYKNLPIKLLHHAVQQLLSKEDCQMMFNRNNFTKKQFCSLIDISTSTYDRAENASE